MIDELKERIHELESALERLLPYLSTQEQLLNQASLNEGRASSFDVASVMARAVLNKKTKKDGIRWLPFQKATYIRGGGISGLTAADVRPEGAQEEHWINNLYQVIVTRWEKQPGFIHLSFKAQDGSALHDWRDMQRLKNELCGEDWVGFEIFPPEKHLIDSANQFHIWCFKDVEVPFMWQVGRLVCEEKLTQHGSQRPWPEGEQPPDLITKEQVFALAADIKTEKDKKKGVKHG